MVKRRARREFTEDYKRGIVARYLVARDTGQSLKAIADEVQISDSLIRQWEERLEKEVRQGMKKGEITIPTAPGNGSNGNGHHPEATTTTAEGTTPPIPPVAPVATAQLGDYGNGKGEYYVLTQQGREPLEFPTLDAGLGGFIEAARAGGTGIRLLKHIPVEVVMQARIAQ